MLNLTRLTDSYEIDTSRITQKDFARNWDRLFSYISKFIYSDYVLII